MDPALAGSGVADDLLTHLLDTALYLNGPITRGRRATRAPSRPNRAVDDAVMALVRFENGSAGTFEATRFGDRLQEPEHVPDSRRRAGCCASTSSG